jgi:uncharacterized protein (DUF2147 family)
MRHSCRKLGGTFLFLSTALFAALPTPTPPDVMGATWLAPDYSTRQPRYVVKFSESVGQFEGRIVKVLDGDQEVPNPICEQCEGALKNKSLLGVKIIYSLKRDDKEYKDGYFLDPISGNVYDSRVWSKEHGRKLQVRAYGGLFFRTFTWTKIS